MKRNGFIATSILYSFFLIFITLFVALVMNYLHNQVLLTKLEEEAWDFLSEMKNLTLYDLEVGDYVQFRTTKDLLDKNETLALNGNSNWIVAYIEQNGTKKTIYFLSDLDAHEESVMTKYSHEQIAKFRPVTVDLYQNLVNNNGVNKYNLQILYNKNKTGENILNIGIVNASTLLKARNQKDASGQPLDSNIMNAVFNVSGSYVVHIDPAFATTNNTLTVKYVMGAYYENRAYAFLLKDAQLPNINNYCGAVYNGTTLSYNALNPFGYTNVVKDSLTNKSYVDYCWYASPMPYTHLASDFVVDEDENAKEGDKLLSTNSILYTLRMMGSTTVQSNTANTYITGGKGLRDDPYIITDGGQKK